jgi:hypothetical protein
MKEANYILDFKERLLLFITIFFGSSFLGYIDDSKIFQQQGVQTEFVYPNNRTSDEKVFLYNRLIQFSGKKGALFNFNEYTKSALLTVDKLTKIKFDIFSLKEYFPFILHRFNQAKQIYPYSKKSVSTNHIA